MPLSQAKYFTVGSSLERGLWLPVAIRDVLEAGVLREEHDLHGPDRAVALLADDDLGDVGLVRRQVLLVHGLPIEKQDQVAVLLQRAGIMTHDSVGKPGCGPRYGQVEDVFDAVGIDRD